MTNQKRADLFKDSEGFPLIPGHLYETNFRKEGYPTVDYFIPGARPSNQREIWYLSSISGGNKGFTPEETTKLSLVRYRRDAVIALTDKILGLERASFPSEEAISERVEAHDKDLAFKLSQGNLKSKKR